jgi:inward rectifier potassium channel
MATPPKPGEDPDRDLGFGGRVAQETRQRFLNRDGSFNVERHGLPFFRSLTLYHAVLNVSWPAYFLIAAGGYLATNLVFALGYLACGPGALRGGEAVTAGDRFLEAFFFSVHTLATIGYGHISPAGLTANLLVTLEALVGLLGFALATGLLFARVSRPTTRILFSRQAVVAPYQGGSALMFRIVNERSSQLIEVAATVSLAWFERREGVLVRRFHELALERKRVVFFPLHWVIVHPIDERSPLFGVTPERFAAADPEVLILLTAVDETFSQTVHARSSYKADEVVWGGRFKDMFASSTSGRVAIDLARLHEIERPT